jgi:gliding motility-associated-like protein
LKKKKKELNEDKNISQFDEWLKDQLNNAEVPAPDGMWEGMAEQVQQVVQNAASTASTATQITNVWTQLSGLAKIAIVGATVGTAAVLTYTLTSDSSQTSNSENRSQNELVESVNENLPDNNQEPVIEEAGNEDVSTGSDTDSYKEVKENKPEFTTPPTALQTDRTPINPEATLNESGLTPQGDGKKGTPNKESQETQKQLIELTDTVLCKGDNINIEAIFGKSGLKLLSVKSDKGSDNIFDKYGRIESGNQVLTIRVFDDKKNTELWRKVKVPDNKLSEIRELQKNKDLIVLSSNGDHLSERYWFVNGNLVENGDLLNYFFNQGETAENTTVKMVAKTSFGCWDSTIWHGLQVVNSNRDIFIPNVITPNGDGENDEFKIIISGEEQYNIVIFDRQNRILFQTNDKNNNWDGTDRQGNSMPSGTYYYKFEYKFPNDTIQNRHGIIELIRTN